MLITGLAQQAARVGLTLRPHTWRPNPVSDPPPPADRDTAVGWFDTNRAALLTALEITIERLGEPDLALLLADALDGLLDWTGHHHDRACVAELALAVLIGRHWTASVLGEEEARTRRHVVRMALVHARLAHARTDLDDHVDALRAAATAAVFAHQSGDPGAVAAALAARGRAVLAQGFPAAAVEDLRHALDVDQAHDDDHATATHRHLLGQALAALGRHHEALVELRLALVTLAEIGDRVTGARVLTTMGAVLRRTGDTRGAAAVLGQALRVLDVHGAHAHLGDVHAELARTHRDTGATAAAAEHFRTAAEHYRLSRLEGLALWVATEPDTT